MDYKKHLARQLRREQTEAEKKLWEHLRNRQFENLKFRRQHPLKDYILDFFCEEYGIVIELDGSYHRASNQKEKDERRDMHLRNLGFLVLRFENEMVFTDMDNIFENIKSARKNQKTFAEQRKLQLEERKKNKTIHLTPTLSSRRGSPIVLSTKILTPAQKSLALNAGLRLVEYNAISINYLNFELPEEKCDAFIFTSQNGVRAYLAHQSKLPSSVGEKSELRAKAFCVGEKTNLLLKENRFDVIAHAENAEALANIIVENYNSHNFLWLTGNKRRNELPFILKKEKVRFTELIVYETVPNPKKIDTSFDGILFFSPSAVSSFMENNSISGTAFCIGNTTAEEVKKYTHNYLIANKPTIENVLVQAVKRLKTHD